MAPPAASSGPVGSLARRWDRAPCHPRLLPSNPTAQLRFPSGQVLHDLGANELVDHAADATGAVFPVVGWWREQLKLGRSDRKARFSLVVSIETPPMGVDIYAPVKAQIRVAVPTAVTTQE